MIKIPKITNVKDSKDICKCRPICKNRRRMWKGEIQKTSAEKLLDRKPPQECLKIYPEKVYDNSLCPLYGKRRISIKARYFDRGNVVRICQTPIDDCVDTPYLKYAGLAMRLGAWDAVRARCEYCACGVCCACGPRVYELRDDPRDLDRADMRTFDARVIHCPMKIMYDV